jgi:hypothetical protein
MAESSLGVSKQSLDQHIAVQLGIDPSAPITGEKGQMIDRIRKSGLRSVYFGLTSNGEQVEWSFTHPAQQLNLIAGQADYDMLDDFAWVGAIGPRLVYQAGTNFISAEKVDSHTLLESRARESGSTLTATITSSQTTLVVDSVRNFPTGLVPFTILIGTEQLQVTAVSGTTFTANRGTAGAGNGFHGTTQAAHTAADIVTLLGPPKRFAIRPKSGVGSATEGQRFELLTFPTPDTSLTINYRYSIQPDDVTDALPFPLGGAQHGETFLMACLARTELLIKGEPGPLTAEFKMQLGASIAMDRRVRANESEQFPIAPTTIGSYGWLASELGRVMELGANPALWTWSEQEAVRSAINRGVIEVLKPAVTGNPRHRGHRWSFMSSFQTLTTSAPYSTGTVTIADGTVTLAGGTWPSWAASGTLSIAGVMYFVASRTSDTVLVLANTSVDADAGTTYNLGRERYTLPSNLSALEPSCFTFEPGRGYPAIQIVHADRIKTARRYGYYSAWPYMVALASHTPDSSAPTARYLWLFPIPGAQLELLYRARSQASAIDGDDFPPGGVELATTYLAAAKAQYDPQSQQEFLSVLASAIDMDLELFQSAPLGENADRSDYNREWPMTSDYSDRHRYSSGSVYGTPYP